MIRVLSYNIHKGFSASNQSFVLERIKASIEEAHADLVLLQEVVGHHESERSRIPDWPTRSQFEYLADRLWPHFAYGRNAVYSQGHHGNAILSKFPIVSWDNQDVSLNRLERRGLLHAAIEAPPLLQPLHAICVHLGLFEADRQEQLDRLCRRVDAQVPPGAPLIVGGDFNDWRERAGAPLERRLGLDEAFRSREGRHARTFPSWLPVFRLDRLYFRGFTCRSARLLDGPSWRELSDHLPILAELTMGA